MILKNLTTTEIEPSDEVVALLPIGAIEQHGLHLPVATDTIITEFVATQVESYMHNDILLLPTMHFGNSIEHVGFKGNISIKNRAALEMYKDILESIESWGIKRLVLSNVHGGNISILQAIVEEWNREHKMKIKNHTVFSSQLEKKAEELFGYCDPHAGSVETSVLLAIKPSLLDSVKGKIRPVSSVYTGSFSYFPLKKLNDEGVLNQEESIDINIEHGKTLLKIAVNDLIKTIQNISKINLK